MKDDDSLEVLIDKLIWLRLPGMADPAPLAGDRHRAGDRCPASGP